LAVSITSLIIFGIANLRPAVAITVAGLIQAGRLLGAESGYAFAQTYVRERVYSNLIGLNVSVGNAVTEDRTAPLSQMLSDKSTGLGNATGAVRQRSTTRCGVRPMCWPTSTPSGSSPGC
jgi:hypothetical protein